MKRQSVSRNGTIILVVALLVALSIGCIQGIQSVSPEEFYKGKTMTLVVSSTVGSGTDLIGRAVGPHLAKEIGATLKIENVRAEEGLNDTFTEGPRDGLTIVINSANAYLTDDILKTPGTVYETEKFNFVGLANPSTTMFQISPKLPHKTLEALRQAKGLKGGATTAKGSIAVSGALMFEMLGLDGRIVTGYGGKSEVVLALAKGEVDFMVTSDSSAKKDQDNGNLINLFSVSRERSPAVPDVPTVFELGVDVPKELVPIHEYVTANGTALALPPEVAKERVEYLRKAFVKLNDNKDVQSDVQRVVGVWRTFIPGDKVQESMNAVKANKALAGQIEAMFEKYKSFQ